MFGLGQWRRQEKRIRGARAKISSIRGARAEKCIEFSYILA
jgi:hypothetical protein